MTSTLAERPKVDPSTLEYGTYEYFKYCLEPDSGDLDGELLKHAVRMQDVCERAAASFKSFRTQKAERIKLEIHVNEIESRAWGRLTASGTKPDGKGGIKAMAQDDIKAAVEIDENVIKARQEVYSATTKEIDLEQQWKVWDDLSESYKTLAFNMREINGLMNSGYSTFSKTR